MDDLIDHANDLAQREIDSLLLGRTPSFVGDSADECIDCGELIPEKRRQLLKGVKLCVDCQALKERSR